MPIRIIKANRNKNIQVKRKIRLRGEQISFCCIVGQNNLQQCEHNRKKNLNESRPHKICKMSSLIQTSGFKTFWFFQTYLNTDPSLHSSLFLHQPPTLPTYPMNTLRKSLFKTPWVFLPALSYSLLQCKLPSNLKLTEHKDNFLRSPKSHTYTMRAIVMT